MKLLFVSLLSLTLIPGYASNTKKQKPKTNSDGQVKTIQIDTSESHVEWFGKKPLGTHHGKLKFKTGTLKMEGDMPKSGTLVVDMTSLNNNELSDEEKSQQLTDHLRSPDFFDVNNHKTAELKIENVTMKKGGSYLIDGKLIIKGIPKEKSFTFTTKKEGGNLVGMADVTFDRTDYKIKFKSKKFFGDLADNFIYDDVNLKVKVVLK